MTEQVQFPVLFKKASSGALQSWAVKTEGATIVTRWGLVGGAQQESIDMVGAGKNLGRSNATTPVEQARAEAESRWKKQKKNKGYVETMQAAEQGETDALVLGGVTPMLAHRYDEHGHKIRWPALVQPKLDGHRCVAVVQSGKATLWSRTRKPITGVPHIEREIERCFDDGVLDGELYNHEYKSRFEELSSFIRSATPKPGHEVVQYHFYDTVNHDAVQQHRYETLMLLDPTIGASKSLVPVQTIEAKNEDEMMQAFETFLDQGYEGAMVRNLSGAYVGKRSYDLQKVKTMADAEFTIVDVKEGRGKMAGKAIFTCATGAGLRFDVKLAGPLAQLEIYWREAASVVGRKLTVKYQNLTADGLPRFPVGVRLHDAL